MKKIFNKFNLTLNLWISFIINVVLSIVLPLVAIGTLNFGIFLHGFLIAFPVSTIIVLLIPLNRLGDAVASGIG